MAGPLSTGVVADAHPIFDQELIDGTHLNLSPTALPALLPTTEEREGHDEHS